MEKLVTPEDLEANWGIARATQYAWRYKGVGPPSIKVGRHLRYKESALESWLEGQASGRIQGGPDAA